MEVGLAKTSAKLLSFKELPLGWHYGTGGPIGAGVIDRALMMLRGLKLPNMQTDAFPGEDGGVLLCAYCMEDVAEIRLGVTEEVSLIYERDDQELFYQERIDVEEAIAKIRQLTVGPCYISASLTPGITISISADLQVRRSGAYLRNEVVALRSSNMRASPRQARTYAVISRPITHPQYRAPPPYFLSSTKQSFQKVTL